MPATRSRLRPRAPPGTLEHDALFYTDAASYRRGLLDFVRAGLERDEPVLVAVPQPGPRPAARGADRGRGTPRVRLRDMAVAGRNPGRIIGTVLTAFVREHAGRRVRIIGEPIWAGRAGDEYPACAEHEALINVALGSAPAYILCPYDAAKLDRVRAHRRHPHAPHARPGLRALGQPRLHRPRRGRRVLRPPAESRSAGEADVRRHRARHRCAVRAGLVHDDAPDARDGRRPRLADLRLVAQELAVNTARARGGSRPAAGLDGGRRRSSARSQDGGPDHGPAGRAPPARRRRTSGTGCSWCTRSATSSGCTARRDGTVRTTWAPLIPAAHARDVASPISRTAVSAFGASRRRRSGSRLRAREPGRHAEPVGPHQRVPPLDRLRPREPEPVDRERRHLRPDAEQLALRPRRAPRRGSARWPPVTRTPQRAAYSA